VLLLCEHLEVLCSGDDSLCNNFQAIIVFQTSVAIVTQAATIDTDLEVQSYGGGHHISWSSPRHLHLEHIAPCLCSPSLSFTEFSDHTSEILHSFVKYEVHFH